MVYTLGWLLLGDTENPDASRAFLVQGTSTYNRKINNKRPKKKLAAGGVVAERGAIGGTTNDTCLIGNLALKRETLGSCTL